MDALASIGPTQYAFRETGAPHWTTAQEKSIATDFPLEIAQESPEQYVNRTYLQFLWLPESVMPLDFLVPCLRRVIPPPSSDQSKPHPMHALLGPLLLTSRAITTKYHIELLQILVNGGGAGEVEEAMMWYALHHEKTEVQTGADELQEPWSNEKWKQSWVERLERREIQIQILLYMLKLTLPGPSPPVSSPSKKRKRIRTEPVPETPAFEERLETLMDKLSVLQLTGHLEAEADMSKLNKNERDWAQVFCEDVVERTFQLQLPELCSLFRSKVFPDSPFSDTDTATASRSPSPQLRPDPRVSSPIPLTSARDEANHPIARSRSRSLSVSLAQEKERERSVSIGPNKKRLLNREVSMSRVFKPKPKLLPKVPEQLSVDSHMETLMNNHPKENEVILVEDTPVKPRNTSSKSSQSHFDGVATSIAKNLFGAKQASQTFSDRPMDETDDDDAWMLDSSPDVLLLRPGHKSGEEEDEYEAIAFQTPSKISQRR